VWKARFCRISDAALTASESAEFAAFAESSAITQICHLVQTGIYRNPHLQLLQHFQRLWHKT
jgi:hypothetical protein